MQSCTFSPDLNSLFLYSHLTPQSVASFTYPSIHPFICSFIYSSILGLFSRSGTWRKEVFLKWFFCGSALRRREGKESGQSREKSKQGYDFLGDLHWSDPWGIFYSTNCTIDLVLLSGNYSPLVNHWLGFEIWRAQKQMHSQEKGININWYLGQHFQQCEKEMPQNTRQREVKWQWQSLL